MRLPQAGNDDATARRGVLLLVVLLILALFVVIGAVALLMTLRARESARAFATATMTQAGSAAVARAQLDTALLKLIRGPSQAAGAGDVSESLLEDKYGTSQTATATAASAVGPLVQVTVTGLDTSNPATIAGRVLTFVPAAGDPTGPTSYRILRVNQGSTTLLLANVKQATPLPLPTVFPCEVVINGREFDGTANDEPYDAFDANNAFLTNSGTLANSRVQQVTRPAFGNQGQTCTVDNDGDGVLDGIWLDGVLPPQRTPDGGQLSFSMSYLVVDLDGRINLNAHGSVARSQGAQTTAEYPQDPLAVPVGMGFGPAEVDAARLLTATNASVGQVPPPYATLLNGGAVTTNAATSSTTQWRPAPKAETTQWGRYGATAGPGLATATTGGNSFCADYWMLNPAGNSPTDLKARLQVFTEGSPPVLKFARPTNAIAWVSGTDTDDIVGSGITAHPYALRLDEDAPRAAGGSAIDAPYTVAELERILRPFDHDAAQLAPRLAAILDDYAERSRMTVTTDSWDTPAITGPVAQTIASAVAGVNPNAVLSPETVAGLRFNLNRPLVTSTDRQDYFRQLYSLCVALGVPAADAAQWTANVIEFRDPDSIMTWYPYDPTPLDGTPAPPWTTTSTGTGVWGMERPEVVITSASSQSGSKGSATTLNFSLYRPWSAHLCSGVTTTATGTTELIDPRLSLQVSASNTLNLTGSSGVDAIWQLVVSNTVPLGTRNLGSLITTATAVRVNTAVSGSISPLSGTATQVLLQRLANPAAVRNSTSTSPDYNDYVPIHRVNVPQAARSVSRWLHWPNRDFVSHGELLTVLSGTPAVAPEVMFSASESALARQYPAILEATIVPSRFAGAVVSATSGLAGTGYENFQYGQFSRWREAGRVNVNTILPNTGNTPNTLDNAVWAALVGGTSVPNPVTAGTYTPVQSLQTLLTGPTANLFARSGANAASAFLERATAIRLANCVTTRSHVFAVWITLRITDDSPNAGPPRFARLFAIVDRSIPVGYAPGRTLNARETIRLVRYLE